MEDQPDKSQRGAGHRKTGRRKDTRRRSQLFRPHQGMRTIDGALQSQLPIHIPAREAYSDAHSNREYVQLLGAEWRTLSLALLGPHLRPVRQLYLDQREPRAEVRRAV